MIFFEQSYSKSTYTLLTPWFEQGFDHHTEEKAFEDDNH